MDLHVERLPDGAVRDRELLAADELSSRYELAARSGASWNRWSLYWDMVDRGGGYRWSIADEIVRRDAEAGLRSLVILQGTPARHANRGQSLAPASRVGGTYPGRLTELQEDPPLTVQASPPTGLYEAAFRDAESQLTDDPASAAEVNEANPWASFVAAAVDRYRPGGGLASELGWSQGEGVRAWEIGNEPNLSHFWSGTPEEFARYLEVAALVIRWLDPQALVLHGGIAGESNAANWYADFLAALRRRADESPLPRRYGFYFDASAWHWYTYPTLLNTGPSLARGLILEHDLPQKPVWVTEMGVPIWSEYPGPCWDPQSPWRASVAEQAAYAWQATAEGLASGVATLVHFQLSDDCGNGPSSYDAFGLMRNTEDNQCWQPPNGHQCWQLDPTSAGTARPALDAYRTVFAELKDAELLWRPPRSADGWQRVLFYRPPDERVTVAWNWRRSPQSPELTATGSRARTLALAADGSVIESEMTPASGRYRPVLAAATNRNNPANGAPAIAGRPVMLVERDIYPPYRAEVRPLPAESQGTIELEVSAADGGTGIGSYRVWVADTRAGSVADWRLLKSENWSAEPLSGVVRVRYDAEPGSTAYFVAQAADRAGNWTAPPTEPQAWTRVVGSAPDTPTASTPPAQPEATVSPTFGATKSPSPPATVSPVPHCRTIDVRRLDGELLSEPGVRWWLRSYAENGEIRTFEGVPGETVCLDTAPARELVWAAAPGHVSPAPQDPDESSAIYLPPAPNTVENWGFEAGLAAWSTMGELRPQPSRRSLSGSGAAMLGSPVDRAPTGGLSGLAQDIDLPAGESILSLDLLYPVSVTSNGSNSAGASRFEVLLIDLDDPAGRVSYLTGRDGLTEPTDGWEHMWFDVSRWSERHVRLELNLRFGEGDGPCRAWIDNVAAGVVAPGN